MDSRSWRLLSAAPHPDIPLLLVATSFGPESYSVYITDLANVWTESLDRRAICMRAFQENTAIDPSYDKEQMDVFLDKLRVALDRNHPEHEQSRLSLSAAGPTSPGDLVLQVTSLLPQGLLPLQWPINLKKQPCSCITTELVLPLIHAWALQQRMAKSLVVALRDKDAVINKLLDKLNAMGASTESAFPSLVLSSSARASTNAVMVASGGGGRRGRSAKMSRADMERRVKGLAPFDEAALSKRYTTMYDDGSSEDTAYDLIETVFGGGGGVIEGHRESGLSCDTPQVLASIMSTKKLDTWWTELGTTGNGIALTRTLPQKTQHGPEDGARRTVDDDGFQTTLSLLASEKKAAAPVRLKNSSSPTPKTTTNTATKPQAGGLGRIGCAGAAAKERAVEDYSRLSHSEAVAEDDLDTASEAEDGGKGDLQPAPVVTTVLQHTSPITTRGVLGRIDDMKAKEPSPVPDVQGMQANASADLPVKAAKKGLGHIGGIAATPAFKDVFKDATGHNEAGKASETTTGLLSSVHKSPVNDGEQAQALQQAVERHAAPARKKRKF